MFSHMCVKNSVHRGVSAPLHAGIHPLADALPWADTALCIHPQGRHPPRQTPPLGRHPPGRHTPSKMATTASYANAFLFRKKSNRALNCHFGSPKLCKREQDPLDLHLIVVNKTARFTLSISNSLNGSSLFKQELTGSILRFTIWIKRLNQDLWSWEMVISFPLSLK